jgi:hypothetical protein
VGRFKVQTIVTIVKLEVKGLNKKNFAYFLVASFTWMSSDLNSSSLEPMT